MSLGSHCGHVRRVYGRTFTQVISQLEKTIDAEVVAAMEGISTVTVTPVMDQPLLTESDGSRSLGSSSSNDGEAQSDAEQDNEQDHLPTCQLDEANVSKIRLLIYGDELYDSRFGVCTMKDAPPVTKRTNARDISSTDTSSSSDSEDNSIDNSDASSSNLPAAAPSSSSTASTAPSLPGASVGKAAVVANATKALPTSGDTINGSGSHAKSNASSSMMPTSVPPATTSSSTTSASSSTQVASGVSSLGSTQSMGRLENIFLRITKKSTFAFLTQWGSDSVMER
jgi:hypothetical protein